MMKHLLIIGAVTVSALANAQAIPNGGFETWVNHGTYEDPTAWGTSNIYSLMGAPETVTKSTDAHSGTYAAKIETVLGDLDGDGSTDTIYGNMFLGSFDIMSGDGIDGAAFTARPDSVAAWYKFAPQGGDYFMAVVTLSRWNSASGERDVIATGSYVGMTELTNYTRVATPLQYESAATPDTLSYIISSATLGLASTTPGTAVWVDDIAFVTNSTAGTDELSATLAIQCFPNPANQTLTIVAAPNTSIEVYNSVGMHMETIRTGSAEKISLATDTYANGVYFLETGNAKRQRFVVQH